MEVEVKSAINKWIKGPGPESTNENDMRRYYDIIYQCLISGCRIDSDDIERIIKENLNWDSAVIEDFASEKAILADDIIGFIDYLKSEKNINIYNLL